jgi:4-diphosphocytidyl-2-C-methyl-D-erythritol kinase
MPLKALYDLPAPAKINSFLHIVGRRSDGYHLLQSAFFMLDWCDVLHLECRSDGRLLRHDLGPALPADDLCLRAARALQAESGTALGVDIHLHKHLPWGAGLGGGSSDAATTLLGLNQLWGLHWPRPRLLALALALGADVPFFVGGRAAWVEGIGEHLTPLPWPEQHYAVLKPAAALPTADVFAHPGLVRNTEVAILAGFPANAQTSGHSGLAPQAPHKPLEAPVVKLVTLEQLQQGFGHNDLEAPARSLCPDIARASDLLQRLFGNSRMSGSGSAVFARLGASSPPQATFPAAPLPPGWVGRTCTSLELHPLHDWAAD